MAGRAFFVTLTGRGNHSGTNHCAPTALWSGMELAARLDCQLWSVGVAFVPIRNTLSGSSLTIGERLSPPATDWEEDHEAIR